MPNRLDWRRWEVPREWIAELTGPAGGRHAGQALVLCVCRMHDAPAALVNGVRDGLTVKAQLYVRREGTAVELLRAGYADTVVQAQALAESWVGQRSEDRDQRSDEAAQATATLSKPGTVRQQDAPPEPPAERGAVPPAGVGETAATPRAAPAGTCKAHGCENATERDLCGGCWAALPDNVKGLLRRAGGPNERGAAQVQALAWLEQARYGTRLL